MQEMERHMSIAVQEFLGFLEDDILTHPEVIKPFSQDLAERITALTADISISLTD
jgi:hypothetical protein